MSSINYDDAQFQVAAPPLPTGRTHCTPTLTPARQEFDKRRKKNHDRGVKAAQTRAARHAGAGPAPSLGAPQRTAASTASGAAPATSQAPPGTPRQFAPLPRTGQNQRPPLPLQSSTPQQQRPLPQHERTPLQPVSANGSTPTYSSFTQLLPSSTPQRQRPQPPLEQTPLQPVPTNGSRLTSLSFTQLPNSSPSLPTPPSTQVYAPAADPSAQAWYESLSEPQRANLMSSLNPMGTSTLGDNWQQLPHLHSMGASDGPGMNDDGEEQDFGSQQHEEPSDDDDEPTPPVSSLQVTMRDIVPSYSRSRKRKRSSADDADEDEDADEDDDEETLPPPKKKSRSIGQLSEEHQQICELAFDKLKIELTLRMPFPVSVGRGRGARSRKIDEFTELILNAFTEAAFDLGFEDAVPTKADIDLIRSRVPQFRGKVKTLARVYVPAAYELVDIQTLRDPTPEKVEAQVGKNRKRVNHLQATFIYQNPDNITPDTMFGNSVFSNVFTAFFFGTGDNNRAFYFEGETQVQLATLALIIVAASTINTLPTFPR
ncbi:hypothetical protein C8R46DRAFT_1223784 [Mycena filopes]|nr:hypothetical protein C8R46DRAFT_1223784 [Mycena filopes]